jgi:hypothetical protein
VWNLHSALASGGSHSDAADNGKPLGYEPPASRSCHRAGDRGFGLRLGYDVPLFRSAPVGTLIAGIWLLSLFNLRACSDPYVYDAIIGNDFIRAFVSGAASTHVLHAILVFSKVVENLGIAQVANSPRSIAISLTHAGPTNIRGEPCFQHPTWTMHSYL